MKLADYSEIIKWMDDAGLSIDNYQVRSRKPATVWTVKVPETYLRMLAMANVLIGLDAGESFRDTALWVEDVSVWDEQNSIKLFNRVRAAASGDMRDVNAAPVTFFGANEFDDFFLLTLLAILGTWDGYIIPKHGRFFFALSHDGFVDMVYQNPQEAQKINQYFRQLKFDVLLQSEEGFVADK